MHSSFLYFISVKFLGQTSSFQIIKQLLFNNLHLFDSDPRDRNQCWEESEKIMRSAFSCKHENSLSPRPLHMWPCCLFSRNRSQDGPDQDTFYSQGEGDILLGAPCGWRVENRDAVVEEKRQTCQLEESQAWTLHGYSAPRGLWHKKKWSWKEETCAPSYGSV